MRIQRAEKSSVRVFGGFGEVQFPFFLRGSFGNFLGVHRKRGSSTELSYHGQVDTIFDSAYSFIYHFMKLKKFRLKSTFFLEN